MEEPGFFDKFALGFWTGSTVISKVAVGEHLQVFLLARGNKRMIGVRHAHGGDIKYYSYPESEARLLAEKIIEFLPLVEPTSASKPTSQ